MADACTRCGAAVWPVITEGGLYRELDPEPVDTGNHVIIDLQVAGDTRTRARVLTGTSGGADGRPAYRVHQCPPPPPGLPGPDCRICGREMSRAIALQLGWLEHPRCGDRERTRAAVEARDAPPPAPPMDEPLW